MDLASVLYGPYTPDQSMEVTMCMTITMTMVTATAIIIMLLVAGWICECCRSTNDDNVEHLHGIDHVFGHCIGHGHGNVHVHGRGHACFFVVHESV